MTMYIPLQDSILYCVVFFSTFCLWKIFGTHIMKKNTYFNPPEPAGKWPLIGHLHLLGANKILHHTLGDLADRYGPIFSLNLGIKKTLVVTSWEVAKECFTTQDRVFSSRPKSVVGEVVGYKSTLMIFQSYGPHWREIRKVAMVELLSRHRLDMLKHVRESEINIFIKELYEQWASNGKGSKVVLEMKERFGDLTSNISVRTTAGKKYSGTGVYGDEQSRRFQKAMKNLTHLAGLFMVSDALPFFGWIDALRGYNEQMKKSAREIDIILGSWVKEHRQVRESMRNKHLKEDFIHVMLSVMDGNQFSEIDCDTAIKGACLSIILGGFESTSSTLTWALSLLLNNRQALKKARDELDNYVGGDRQVQESDVKNLTYLQAIVKETLRLYPPVPLSVQHESMEDCTIAGFHIPAGTRLSVNLYKLHRDPSIWSDPLEFQPERFLEKHLDVDVWGQHFELLPFGSGRRSCPGITFALQILHLTLARLLHGFDLGKVLDLPINMTESAGLANSKATPLEVTFSPRLPHPLYV